MEGQGGSLGRLLRENPLKDSPAVTFDGVAPITSVAGWD